MSALIDTFSHVWLVEHGWRTYQTSDQFMKVLDGYVGIIRALPQSPARAAWFLWFTAATPIDDGVCATIIDAAIHAELLTHGSVLTAA
jgi:hypothetical protein